MFQDKVAVVTGGAQGIGRCICEEFAKQGARVCTIDLLENDFFQGDVGKKEDLERFAQKVIQTYGRVDFLVNNAGITKKCRAEDFPMEDFERILRVNVTGIFSLCQSAYPYLKESRHKGRIVNISSMAAHLGFSEVVPYCTSKAAVCGLTRGLAVEWANDNITVNSIAPGWFPSEMSKQVMTPERKQAILGRMPVHAFGDPKDLGAMARFLLGDGAKYITGQDFAVDGGALAYGF